MQCGHAADMSPDVFRPPFLFRLRSLRDRHNLNPAFRAFRLHRRLRSRLRRALFLLKRSDPRSQFFSFERPRRTGCLSRARIASADAPRRRIQVRYPFRFASCRPKHEVDVRPTKEVSGKIKNLLHRAPSAGRTVIRIGARCKNPKISDY